MRPRASGLSHLSSSPIREQLAEMADTLYGRQFALLSQNATLRR